MKVQLGEAEIVLSPLSKKSFPLKSKVNELGKAGLGSCPFMDFLFPSGKSLSTFVTQFPQMRKHSRAGREDGAGQGLVPAGAAEQPWAHRGSSHKFCSAAKSLGGKEVFLVSCDGKPAQEFALRHLKVVSVQLNVSFSFQSQVLQLFSPSAGHWALLKAAKTYKIRFHLRRKRDFFLSSTKGPSLRFGSHPSVWSQPPKTSRGII